MKNILNIQKLSFYVTVTPTFENLLKNEIKRIFKNNNLLLPKFGKNEIGGIEFDVSTDENDYYIPPPPTSIQQSINTENNNDHSNMKKKLEKKSMNEKMNDPHHNSLNIISKYLWSLCNCSRLAESIRIRLNSERVPTKYFNQLEASLNNIPWLDFFPSSTEIPQISVSCSNSKLYHSKAVQERIQHYFKTKVLPEIKSYQISEKSKLRKKLKKELRNMNIPTITTTDIDNKQNEDQQQEDQEKQPPQPKLYVRIENDEAQLSIDATSIDGVMLHKRLRDKYISEAPLRETIAAAALVMSMVTMNNNSIWDPFCGGATLIQESLGLIQGNKIPTSTTNVNREFQFQYFPWHLSEQYNEYIESIKPKIPTTRQNNRFFIGSDISEKAIQACKFNLSQEGYQIKILNQRSNIDNNEITENDYIFFENEDFQEVYKNIQLISKRYQTPFTIISNIPYGHRVLTSSGSLYKVSDKLRDTFERFGKMLKESDPMVIKNVYIINGNQNFQEISKVNWTEIKSFKNGGLPVQLLSYQRDQQKS